MFSMYDTLVFLQWTKQNIRKQYTCTNIACISQFALHIFPILPAYFSPILNNLYLSLPCMSIILQVRILFDEKNKPQLSCKQAPFWKDKMVILFLLWIWDSSLVIIFFIDSTVTYIKKGKEEKFHKGQRQAGPWGHPSTSKILWAANCFKYHSWKWCRDGESVHCVCAGSYYLNQYQCFKNWQEHEDLEASLIARKPKWNIKYLKSRSDLINAFSSNPAFKLSHSIGEMDLKWCASSNASPCWCSYYVKILFTQK